MGFVLQGGLNRCRDQGLVAVAPLGEIVERYLGFIALLLDVAQHSCELIGRHEPGKHCYGLPSRIEKDESGV